MDLWEGKGSLVQGILFVITWISFIFSVSDPFLLFSTRSENLKSIFVLNFCSEQKIYRKNLSKLTVVMCRSGGSVHLSQVTQDTGAFLRTCEKALHFYNLYLYLQLFTSTYLNFYRAVKVTNWLYWPIQNTTNFYFIQTPVFIKNI